VIFLCVLGVFNFAPFAVKKSFNRKERKVFRQVREELNIFTDQVQNHQHKF
jgi:hypothetical protein